MLIDDQARECVAFLSVDVSEEDTIALKPVASAFFIGENIGGDRWVKYIVTARHVLDQSRPYGPLWLRCVSKDGSEKKLAQLDHNAWIMHPTADVAVAPLQINLDKFDVRFVPKDILADTGWIDRHNIGVGDHLAVPGLFRHHLGEKRDEPIVRFGRIAHISPNKVKLPAEGGAPSMEMQVILADLSSWGGQSGSPAWAYFSVDRHLFGGEALNMEVPSPRLLGVLHGHYSVRQIVEEDTTKPPWEREEQPSVSDNTPSKRHVRLNSGIAIIVPAPRILDLLQTKQAKQVREEFREVLREEGVLY